MVNALLESCKCTVNVSLLCSKPTHLERLTAILQNNDVPVSHIVPPFKGVRPKEMSRIASQLLFPVNVANDRQYYLSIHAGQIFNPKVSGKMILLARSLLVILLYTSELRLPYSSCMGTTPEDC